MSAEKLAHFITDWIFDISLCENSINRCTRYIYIYIYMCVCRYGQHFQQSKDQLDLVANSAHGQLDKENCFFPVPVRAQESVAVRRARPFRSASARSFSILRLNMTLTHAIPPAFRDVVHRYRQPPWVSPEFIRSRMSCALNVSALFCCYLLSGKGNDLSSWSWLHMCTGSMRMYRWCRLQIS